MAQNLNPALPAEAPGPANTTVQVDYNGTTFDLVRNNLAVTVRADLTASASTTISATNFDARGLIAFFNISELPASGSTTLALVIQASDPVTGGNLILATQAARSASGLTTLVLYPGGSSAANSYTSVSVPRNISFLISASTGATNANFRFSLGVQYLK